MDLTIPYTFYPVTLPHWIAWALFLAAVFGGTVAGVVRGVERGWKTGVKAGLFGGTGFLLVTMIASMVITFLAYSD